MKQALLIILFLSAIDIVWAQSMPTCGDWDKYYLPTNYSCSDYEHGNWELVFEDNFDGCINTEKWYTCYDGWNRQHGTELQYYSDSNIHIDNGILRLQAKHEPGYYPVIYFDSNGVPHTLNQYFEYTSGMLQTKSKFQYGIFEIRCKIPSGQGFWPAFWLYGNGGEIDIFEFNGKKPKTHYMTIHIWPIGDENTHELCPSSWTNTSSFSADYHTFSLEWDEYKLIYRVDGTIKRIDYKYMNILTQGLFECTNQTAGIYLKNPLFPENAQNLIINLAIANDNIGTYGPGPNAQTPFPSSLDVDYIRVYKKRNHLKDISINAFDTLNSDYYTAKNIFINEGGFSLSVNNGETKNLIACEEVVLNPGFTVDEGGLFETRISSGSRNQPLIIHDNRFYSADNVTETPSLKGVFYEEKGKETEEGVGFKNEKEEIYSASFEVSEGLFDVFPNPNKGFFKIKLNSQFEEYQCVQIVNSLGEIVYSINNPTESIYEISLENMTGLFIIRCITNTCNEFKKTILQ